MSDVLTFPDRVDDCGVARTTAQDTRRGSAVFFTGNLCHSAAIDEARERIRRRERQPIAVSDFLDRLRTRATIEALCGPMGRPA